jgi:hypothetical protein
MESNSKTAISRRSLLKAAFGLGAGAALVGVPAFVYLEQDEERSRGSAAGAVPANQSPEPGPDQGPIVAYIRDTSTGEVSVMWGSQEVVVRDTKLVAQLLGMTEV